MTDLLQIVEFGNQTGDDPIRWDGHTSQYLVPAANRTRILNREHHNGHTPGADGWLRIPRVIADDNLVDGRRLTLWTRIRWEAQPHTEIRDLDGGDE